MGLPALFVSAVVSACSCDVCHGYALFISGESNCNVIGEKNFPAKNGAGTVPPEESERSLHDAVFIARQVWEKDCDAVKFDIDDLVQIESALQEICNITAGIDSGDDGE